MAAYLYEAHYGAHPLDPLVSTHDTHATMVPPHCAQRHARARSVKPGGALAKVLFDLLIVRYKISEDLLSGGEKQDYPSKIVTM
jgi:hypothetical protein